MNLLIEGYKLVSTCFACPEQYDVFDNEGAQVAYLRLRHGNFTVTCPDVGGKLVYQGSPRGDGIFEDSERIHYLRMAILKVQGWIIEQQYKPIKAEFEQEDYEPRT